MTATLLTPDVRRIIAELERRLGVLERRINPVAVATAAEDDGHVHDGAGTGSTIIPITSNSPTAAGAEATALGYGAAAPVANSTAVGSAASAVGIGSLAVGDNAATAPSGADAAVGAVAVGRDALASGPDAIAIGDAAEASWGAVALGHDATASGSDSVAVGPNSSASGGQVMLGVGGTHVVVLSVATVTPADSYVGNRQIAFYLNQTTHELKVKVKYSTGTVKTGTVASLV